MFRPSGFSPTKLIALHVANNQTLNVAGGPDAVASLEEAKALVLARFSK
jgi:hypothetical protein